MAGVRGAAAMRRFTFNGEIVIVGEDSHAPYDRPPLSNQLLTQNELPDDVGFPTLEQYTDDLGHRPLSRWRLIA